MPKGKQKHNTRKFNATHKSTDNTFSWHGVYEHTHFNAPRNCNKIFRHIPQVFLPFSTCPSNFASMCFFLILLKTIFEFPTHSTLLVLDSRTPKHSMSGCATNKNPRIHLNMFSVCNLP